MAQPLSAQKEGPEFVIQCQFVTRRKTSKVELERIHSGRGGLLRLVLDRFFEAITYRPGDVVMIFVKG